MNIISANNMNIPPGPGRPAGSLNKRTQRFAQLIEEYGFDAAEQFVWIYSEAKEKYLKRGDMRALNTALDAAREIASYCFPKLKSVEHIKVNPMQGLSPQQRLEMLDEAKKILELEIKANESR
jgi:hypothetical protein